MPDAAQSSDASAKAPAGLTQRIPPPWRQRLLALSCLVLVGLVQWKLVNVDSGPFKEQLTVAAHSETVTFTSPKSSDNGPFSFSYTPASAAKRVLLEAYFDQAQLSQGTVQKLQSLDVSAPSAAGLISYLTTGEGNEACTTSVSVSPEANPSSVSFSESANNPNFGYRSLEAAFQGTETTVTLASEGGDGGLSTCKVDLSVADWQQTTQGMMSISIQVPAGSAFRLHWHDLMDQSDEWTKQLPGQALVDFGSAAADAFTASGVSVTAAGQAMPKFQAADSKHGAIRIGSFRVNRGQLEMSVDGTGVLKKDGKVVSSTNLWASITRYPLVAAALGVLNIALINWVRRAFTSSRPQPAADSARA